MKSCGLGDNGFETDFRYLEVIFGAFFTDLFFF